MEKTIKLLGFMEILLQIISGGEFETREDYLEFRHNLAEAGYDPAIIDDLSPLEVLQIFCKDFAAINLSALKDEVDNVVNTKKAK